MLLTCKFLPKVVVNLTASALLSTVALTGLANSALAKPLKETAVYSIDASAEQPLAQLQIDRAAADPLLPAPAATPIKDVDLAKDSLAHAISIVPSVGVLDQISPIAADAAHSSAAPIKPTGLKSPEQIQPLPLEPATKALPLSEIEPLPQPEGTVSAAQPQRGDRSQSIEQVQQSNPIERTVQISAAATRQPQPFQPAPDGGDRAATIAVAPHPVNATRPPSRLSSPGGYLQVSSGVYVPAQYVEASQQIEQAQANAVSPANPLLQQSLQYWSASANAVTFPLYPLPTIAPITSWYGNRVDPLTGEQRFHAGVDLGIPIGTPAIASVSAQVVFAGWQEGYGNTVILRYNGSVDILYGHLSQLLVQLNQTVAAGQVIALTGNSGRTTGPHLHYEIRQWYANGTYQAQDVNQIIQLAQHRFQSRQQNATSNVTSTVAAASPASVTLRVALKVDSYQFSVSSSTAAYLTNSTGQPIASLPAMQPVTLASSQQGILVNGQLYPTAFFIEPSGGGAIAVDGRWYRGRVLVAARPNGLIAVNWVDLEQYLASVVGGEAYPNWKPAALQAQAIAARSYAMAFKVRPANPQWYDLGATTAYQNYEGIGREYTPTVQAVSDTHGIVIASDGAIVEAQYAATQELTDSAHGGVGMSQWGAASMAANGYDCRSILAAYYPNTQLMQMAWH